MVTSISAYNTLRQLVYDKLGEWGMTTEAEEAQSLSTWFEVAVILAASNDKSAHYSAGHGCWMVDGKPCFTRHKQGCWSDDEQRPSCIQMANGASDMMRYVPQATPQ